MPQEESVSDKFAEYSYATDVEEKYANLYHVYGSHYEIRLAFGNTRGTPSGEHVIGRFHTAIYLDYKLAKDMVAALQTIVTNYESVYGPTDLKGDDQNG